MKCPYCGASTTVTSSHNNKNPNRVTKYRACSKSKYHAFKTVELLDSDFDQMVHKNTVVEFISKHTYGAVKSWPRMSPMSEVKNETSTL